MRISDTAARSLTGDRSLVTDYSRAAEFYDLLYEGEKDYAAEAALLQELLHDLHPAAVSVLDVGCGTGSHARALIDAGFAVDGVDLEPAFVADMTSLDLAKRYDVVTCLFSAVGYVQTESALRAAIGGMRAALNPDGVLIVDPWFEPGQLTHGWISTLLGAGDGVTVVRMSRTLVEGAISRLEFEYLIGRESGMERRSELHTLGLFTQDQMQAAFVAAGLAVERKPAALRTRGLYIGRSATRSADAGEGHIDRSVV